MNKHMIKTILFSCVIAAAAGFSGLLMAEPVGDLPPMNEMAKTMMASQGKSIDDITKDIPTKTEVGLPVYPGSFYTTVFSGEGMLPSVVMASGDPIEKVKAWYAQEDGLTWSDTWNLFYVGDEYVMMKTESVFLQDISENPAESAGGMMYDMSGMKTQFTIAYKPKAAAE
jgi:hypothetical protein